VRSRVAMLLTIPALFVASGCSGGGPPRVAARVGGAVVPSSEVERLTRQWLRSTTRIETDAAVRAPVGRKEAARNALTYLVRLAELDHLARDLAVDSGAPAADVERTAAETPSDDLAASGWSRPDFLETYRAARLSRAIATKVFADIPVSEADLHQDYARQPGGSSPAWDARVGIAYFDAEAPARQVADRVRTGVAFVDAAHALGAREATTLDPVTSATPLPAAVLDGVAKAPIGQVSAPMETGGGFVVFAVEARSQVPARSFDDMQADLRARHVDQERQRRFLDWFDHRLAAERIDVARYYGHWDPAHRLVV
jgi:PPIC-type PPIASE domain